MCIRPFILYAKLFILRESYRSWQELSNVGCGANRKMDLVDKVACEIQDKTTTEQLVKVFLDNNFITSTISAIEGLYFLSRLFWSAVWFRRKIRLWLFHLDSCLNKGKYHFHVFSPQFIKYTKIKLLTVC